MAKKHDKPAAGPDSAPAQGAEGSSIAPVKVRTAIRTPGMKEETVHEQECEKMILITQSLDGVARSEEDPSEFVSRQSAGMECAGFRGIDDMFHLLNMGIIAFLRRISEDDAKFSFNVAKAVQMLLAESRISPEDMTIQISDRMMKEHVNLVKELRNKEN